MKLQHLAVIFIIIIMPISMVISTYVNKLIDVSNTEAQYNSLLMNSTYDAVRAYQINTINNSFASVNSSRIRDINASINTFFNSLSTGLGADGYSKTELESYVPAILFTLYDGFYVYGPYDNYSTETRNNSTSYDSSSRRTEYGLKPFSYYTCEYQKGGGGSYHFIINYTLDNYISVAGKYRDGDGKDKYITASGYYINPEKVSNIDDNNKTIKLDDGTEVGPETLGEYVYVYNSRSFIAGYTKRTVNLQGRLKYYRYINYNEEKYYYDDSMEDDDLNDVSLGYMKDEFGNEIDEDGDGKADKPIPIFYLDKNLKIYISDNMLKTLAENRGCTKEELRTGEKFQDVNNYFYYKKAKEFSEKVNPALTRINIKEGVIKSTAYNNDGNYKIDTENDQGTALQTYHMKYKYTDSGKIFDYNVTNNDPETESSLFNQHRLDVIISTVESNLASSISNFNKYQNSSYDYRMPTVSETDWHKIANNVNVVAFMQGFAVGNYKFYNNYSIVSDTKNKEFISKEAILVQKNIVGNPPYGQDRQGPLLNLYKNNNNEEYYHDPRCKEFHKSIKESGSEVIAYRSIDYEPDSFSHDFSILNEDKTGLAPPPNNDTGVEAVNYYMQPGTGGYECIVSKNTDMWSYDNMISGKDDGGNTISDDGFKAVRKAYLSALAREKGAAFKDLQLLNHNTDNVNSQE